MTANTAKFPCTSKRTTTRNLQQYRKADIKLYI